MPRADSTKPRLPGWVNPASRVIIALQRLGLGFLSFYVLRIPGRRSGVMRATVVSPFTVEGHRYVLSFGHLEWVRNAQAAGWGLLSRGHKQIRVNLVEVKPPASAPIAGVFPRQIPAGVQFFIGLGLVESPGTPEQFQAAAERLTLFRLDPTEATD